MTVPIVDEYEPGRVIYQPRMTRLALAGALAGGLILGWIAWMVAAGPWAVAGLGQFAASGTTVATFTGAGVGVAAGGLAGALAALYRMPARRPGEHSGRARGRGKENER